MNRESIFTQRHSRRRTEENEYLLTEHELKFLESKEYFTRFELGEWIACLKV
jgi:hypothetical protein